MSDSQQTYDLASALEAIRSRLPLVVGLTVLAAAVAMLLTSAAPSRYEATATLLIREPDVGAQISDGPAVISGQPAISPDTSLGLLDLDHIAALAAGRIDGGSEAEIVDDVTLRTGEGPELIDIEASAEDPARATVIANAAAAAAVEFRRDADRESYRTAREALEAELAALPAAEADSAEAQSLSRKVREARALELAQTGGATLVLAADEAAAETGSGVVRNGILGGFAGLVIGLIAALLLERLHPTLRRREDLESVYGAPILAELPRRGGAGSPLDREQLRALWARLRFADPERPLRSVVVSSVRRSAGVSTVALGLARVAAAEGQSTVLVEADLRLPGLAQQLGLPPSPGLAEHLAGDDERLDDLLQDVAGSGPGGVGQLLQLLAAGSVPPNPAGLLISQSGSELVSDLTARAQFVVVDVPALGEVADGLALLRQVDGVVLVDRPGLTERPAVARLVEQLAAANVPVLGVVLNAVRRRVRGI